ncbi:TonB-dependent hemoglobin/transferrin/lactoferrin family receptor [Ursidibacter arcticus]
MKLSKIYTALFLGVPTMSFATEKTIELDAIYVNAVRDLSLYAESSQNVTHISYDQLRSKQITSVADAVKNLPNVDVQGGRSIAQTPNIRGLSGNRVVQIVDGIRQNFDLAHRGSYFTPTSFIQRIDVIKGPSSSLWGSGALGGVVSIRTSNALDLLKSDDKFGAVIRQGYHSANSLSETEAAIFGANSYFDWLIQGAYKDSGDLRLGKGEKLKHSGLKQQAGNVKLGWQVSDSQRLELTHRLGVSKFLAPNNNEVKNELTIDSLNAQIVDCHRTPTCDTSKVYAQLGGVSYLTQQKVIEKSTALHYQFNPEKNSYFNTKITAYQNQIDEKERRLVSDIKDRTKLKTTGFNLQNSSDFNWLALTYGIDYYKDKAMTEREKNNSDAKFRAEPYNASSAVTGVYVISHLPVGQKITFSPSVRYDQYKTKGDKNYRSSNWSPTLALNIQPIEWLELNAKYGKAFRAPSLQERYAAGAHFGSSRGGRDFKNEFVSNPNLKPEIAENKELSAKLRFDDLVSQGDKFLLSSTFFQNDVKDFINLNVYKSNPNSPIPVPDRSQYINIDNARLKGIELEANYQTERLALSTAYSQIRGKNKTTNESLSNVNADKLSFAVNYALVKDKFNVGTTINRYFKQKRVPKDSQAYAGYTLVGLNATYAPLKGEWKDLRIDFAIDNLFDKKYLPAFSLIEGVGRNVKVNLGYYF